MSIGAMLRRDISPSDLAALAADIDGPFHELWIVEDMPYAGGVAQMGEVLAATKYAKVGHGIAPTPFRNPVALAMEWAALAAMYPGRVIAGLGHGVQEWMAQIGAAVESPLTLLDETVRCVRALLGGERVTFAGRYVTIDGVELKFPPEQAPPVFAGVTGPRSLRLAGARADGVILPEGWGPDGIANARLKIAQGAASRGSETETEVAETGVAETEGEAKPQTEVTETELHLTVFAAFHVGSIDRLGPLPGGVGKSWVAHGSSGDEVAEKLLTLFEAGADSVILTPIGASPEYQLDLAASQVVPDLKTALGS